MKDYLQYPEYSHETRDMIRDFVEKYYSIEKNYYVNNDYNG